MSDEQLRLDVDKPLEFIGYCPECHARTEPVPVEEDGRWGAPIAWVYLALEAHRREAHGKPGPP